MVPVYFQGERVGRFMVDIPYSQTELIFHTMSSDQFISACETSTVSVNRVKIQLGKRTLILREYDTRFMNTTEIQTYLIEQGAPYPSANFQSIEHSAKMERHISWRVAEVTLAQLEEVFDLPEYVPE